MATKKQRRGKALVEETFFNTQEAADKLRCTPRQITKLIASGVIAAVRGPGTGARRRFLIPKGELERLLEENYMPSDTERINEVMG